METWTWKREIERRDGDEIVIVTFGEHTIGEQAPYFSVTAVTYGRHSHPGEATIARDGRKYWGHTYGCQHDTVARVFPELRPFLAWHLSAADGPMHYEANGGYFADLASGRVPLREYDRGKDWTGIFARHACVEPGEPVPDLADREATIEWLRARRPLLVTRREAAMDAARKIEAVS